VCDLLAYLPQVKAVGVNVMQSIPLLLLYRVFKCANRFLPVNLDRKHATRIV
jgi:hypothetical protein